MSFHTWIQQICQFSHHAMTVTGSREPWAESASRNSNFKRRLAVFCSWKCWRLWITVGGLGLHPSAWTLHVHCACLRARGWWWRARSASGRCISSSGQVFNLRDPARDYGVLGGEKWDFKRTLQTWRTVCLILSSTKEGFVLHISRLNWKIIEQEPLQDYKNYTDKR